MIFAGQSLLGKQPYEINHDISRVFQTPEVFSDLTVLENVMIPRFAKRDGQFRLNAVVHVMQDIEIQMQAEILLEEVNMQDKRQTMAALLSCGDKRRL